MQALSQFIGELTGIKQPAGYMGDDGKFLPRIAAPQVCAVPLIVQVLVMLFTMLLVVHKP